MPSSRTRGRRTINEINMVPFIDVMLVLLIIFMVTAPLITPSDRPAQPAVVISASIATVRYELVVKVMDTLQRAGVQRVGSVQLAN